MYVIHFLLSQQKNEMISLSNLDVVPRNINFIFE